MVCGTIFSTGCQLTVHVCVRINWRLYNTLLRTKCYRVDCRRLFTGCGERVTLVCVCVRKRVCWQFRLRIARYSRRMFHVCLMIGRFSWQRESFKTNRTFHRANRIQIIWNDRMYTAVADLKQLEPKRWAKWKESTGNSERNPHDVYAHRSILTVHFMLSTNRDDNISRLCAASAFDW